MDDPGLAANKEQVWQNVSNAVSRDWGLYETVSVNLDKSLLEYIVNERWPTIQGAEHSALRAGLVLAVLIPSRKKLMLDAKPAAEKVIASWVSQRSELGLETGLSIDLVPPAVWLPAAIPAGYRSKLFKWAVGCCEG
ncbi:hypothetical protein SpCBS45565_g04457 [Spizellomyces sp. 'palustris']|nr:hypothetical protein SpCBS45565_g04457 [Spizellomyces sp. 'palustris']